MEPGGRGPGEGEGQPSQGPACLHPTAGARPSVANPLGPQTPVLSPPAGQNHRQPGPSTLGSGQAPPWRALPGPEEGSGSWPPALHPLSVLSHLPTPRPFTVTVFTLRTPHQAFPQLLPTVQTLAKAGAAVCVPGWVSGHRAGPENRPSCLFLGTLSTHRARGRRAGAGTSQPAWVRHSQVPLAPKAALPGQDHPWGAAAVAPADPGSELEGLRSVQWLQSSWAAASRSPPPHRATPTWAGQGQATAPAGDLMSPPTYRVQIKTEAGKGGGLVRQAL